MLQKIVSNLGNIGLVIAFGYAIYRWYKYKKVKNEHPTFKNLFWNFSTFYLIYTGITSSLLAFYLILSEIISVSWITVSVNEIKYPLIIGGLSLLYLGITKFKEEEL